MNLNFIIGIILGSICVVGIISLCAFIIKKADYITKKHQNYLLVVVIALVALGVASAFLLIIGGTQMHADQSLSASASASMSAAMSSHS